MVIVFSMAGVVKSSYATLCMTGIYFICIRLSVNSFCQLGFLRFLVAFTHHNSYLIKSLSAVYRISNDDNKFTILTSNSTACRI